MVMLWDYNEKELRKTEAGRIKILERLINYGPTKKGEKIKLSLVKKYWNKLHLSVKSKRLLELLIWGKVISQDKFVSEQERLGMDDFEFFAYCIKRKFRRHPPYFADGK